MNLNVVKISRSVYTFWTVIGEVGALRGVLIDVSVIILLIFGFQKSINYLASQLFRINQFKA